MNDPDTPEGRLIEIVDRWEVLGRPSADLVPAPGAMPRFLQDLGTVLRELRQTRTALTGTIGERDRAESAANDLAYAVAPASVIGEHSDGNDPWREALDLLRSRQTEIATAGTEAAR